jgi:hypothetical protein
MKNTLAYSAWTLELKNSLKIMNLGKQITKLITVASPQDVLMKNNKQFLILLQINFN